MKEINKSIDKAISNLIELTLGEKFSWEKMWRNLASGKSPFNYQTNIEYSGVNAFILALHASIKGSNQFITFKQCSDMGGQIIKGSKSIPLIRWNKYHYDPITHKKYYNKETINKLPKEIKDRLKFTMQPWGFNVFSIKDTTLEPKALKKEKVVKPIEIAQKIVDNYSKDICPMVFGENNTRAFYSLKDYINMPEIDAFKSNKAFYQVCFHEMTHSTGHKNRLNRDMSGFFGNDEYAKEELIAEISAAMLSAKLDLLTDDLIKNSAAYLQSWIKRFSDKKQDLFEAISHATKANKFIIESTKVEI